MPRTRDIRRRIRAVQSTRKITHAMELVAATKMRRASAAVLATRRYSQLAWEFLQTVREREGVAAHPLLAGRPAVRASALLVVAGNRGLVGAFNQKIAAVALRAARTAAVPVHVITTGKVAARLLRRAGMEIAADFPKKDILSEPADAAPIADELLRLFLRGAVDQVQMAYADFHSPVRQEARVRTLLPVGEPDPDLGRVVSLASSPPTPNSRPEASDYLYEPSPEAVLQSVVPNLVSVQIYQALLETTASEHAARMVAMKNATDNAEELADEFTLLFNQARQQQITRELQEITTGQLA